MMKPLLQVNGISKRVQKPKPRDILRQISFTLHEKEILGLMGESGSGKTTLAYALAGIESHEGTVESVKPEGKARISLIFQNPKASFDPGKTIGYTMREIVKHGLKENMSDIQYEKALETVNLSKDKMDAYPTSLSGGECQRAAIACALLAKPSVLICDEPTSALDVINQKKILDLFLKIRDKEGIAMLFISHDPLVIRYVCDNVLIMKEGAIIESGSEEEIFDHPKTEYTRKLLDF